MPKQKPFKLSVTFEFSQIEIMDILKGANSLCVEDNPITFEEVKNSKKLQKYLAKELQATKEEIIDGSYEAVANDWLYDIDHHRLAKYRKAS